MNTGNTFHTRLFHTYTTFQRTDGSYCANSDRKALFKLSNEPGVRHRREGTCSLTNEGSQPSKRQQAGPCVLRTQGVSKKPLAKTKLG